MRPDGKPEGLRQSMSWLHTWSGLLLGWLLYAVFFTGTWSYFRAEVNDWMRPELHASVPDANSAQRALDTLAQLAPNAQSWSISLPTARRVALEASWREATAPANDRRAGTKRVTLDAANGAVLTPRETRASGFFYRFHFELHGMPRIWGRWIVGIATMVMFVAILSGIITHKKIFTDFFTFRPKKGQRSWLDAHNATAVLALPFHLMITFSGLVLLMGQLMPWGAAGVYADGMRGYQMEARGAGATTPATPAARPPATAPHTAAALPDLAPMLARARQQWPLHGVGSITVNAPGTAQATVTLTEAGGSSLLRTGRGGGAALRFDAASGAPLDAPQAPAPSFARATRNVLAALHEGRFAGVVMRWLLFLSGVLGTFMAASGMVLWVVKRLPERRKLGRTPRGHRLVEVLNVGSIAGLSVAMASLFWLNRLLPAGMAGRADWEIHGFFLVWLLCALHPLLCSHRRAWLQQMALATVLYALLPLVNAATGGSALWRSLAHGQWSVASVDAVLLLMAAMHGAVLWWLLRARPLAKAVAKPAAKPVAAVAKPATAAPVATAKATAHALEGTP